MIWQGHNFKCGLYSAPEVTKFRKNIGQGGCREIMISLDHVFDYNEDEENMSTFVVAKMMMMKTLDGMIFQVRRRGLLSVCEGELIETVAFGKTSLGKKSLFEKASIDSTVALKLRKIPFVCHEWHPFMLCRETSLCV